MSHFDQYAGEAGGEEAFEYVDRSEIDDEDEGESPSPRTALLSARGNSRDTLHLAERPRNSSRMERSRRRSSTHRELLKFIVDEEIESVKQTRRALNAALERLAGETRRAQEAERRALEIAQRFKTVNEARIAAQQESARLSEQLVLYKVQFENAERELSRGQDLLKDVESQRDEAEAAAARARDTARRLREQQLIRQAREDGRREGYNEGLRRAYREARMDGFRDDGATDGRDKTQGQPDDGLREARGRLTSLEEFSPDIPGDTGLAPSITVTLEEPGSSSRPPPGSYPGGAEGSRFRENIASPGASTLASLPGAPSARPSGPAPWPHPPPAEGTRFTHPQVVRSASPASQHPNYSVPPDGWIPSADADSFIRLPPPHEMSQQPPVSPRTPLSPLPDIIPMDGGDPSLLQPQVSSHDYAYGGRQRSSPGSFAESLPSTTISSYDLLNSPRTAQRMAGRERGPILSAIEEVPTSMEFSPGTESRARSSIMPEPFALPVRSPRPEGSYTGSDAGRRPASRGDRRENESSAGSSRRKSSRTPRNEPGESVRSSVASVQEWLGKNAADDAMQYQSPPLKSPYSAYVTDVPPMNRSASPFDRPYSSASGDASRHRRSRSMNSPPENGSGHRSSEGHRRVISSGSVAITVQSPSAPGSTASPGGGIDSGRLTPSSTMRAVPPSQPYVPTAPSSPALRNLPSMGTLVDYPPGFVPAGAPSYNMSTTPTPPSPTFSQQKVYSRIIPDQADGGFTDWSRPARTASRNSSRTVNDALRPKTPGARPSSAMDGAPFAPSMSRASSQHSYMATPSRSHTPSDPRYIPPPLQAGMGYAESAQRRSMAPPSPRTLAAGVPLPGSTSALGDSPRSATSRLSGHQRSLSMHAGSTPAANARPLSGASRPQLRRVPSTGSISSNHSAYKHFDPKEYVDPAWAASSENLLDVQSPGTLANTRQNAFGRERSRSPGGGNSPALSYQSLGHRG